MKWLFLLLCSQLAFAGLADSEKRQIEAKLQSLPMTRGNVFRLLEAGESGPGLTPLIRAELEGLLKKGLLGMDTRITRLTPEIRKELVLDPRTAAFHKQTGLAFDFLLPPESAKPRPPRPNDEVRALRSPRFQHAHELFVDDLPISRENNSVILFFHELSHAVFDQWVTEKPEEVLEWLSGFIPREKVSRLFSRTPAGRWRIDSEVYDLLSERYAFELEYRINWEGARIFGEDWPKFYRFLETDTERYRAQLDSFVRSVYRISSPELGAIPATPLEPTLGGFWRATKPA